MIVATIPARGGSKGVPNKNIKLIEGYPLIAYSIMSALLSKQVDRVIVSTDSEEIAEVSKKFGAEVPFLRPSEYAQDNSPDDAHINHTIEWFEKNEQCFPNLLVHLRPTTPMRDPKLIDEAITKFINNPEATSLRSAHKCAESPFKWFLLREDGFFTGLNTDDMEEVNKPRQQFEQAYIPNGYVDILSIKHIKETGKLHGNKMASFITPPCIEIDTEYDLKHLELDIKLNHSIMLKSLQKHFPIK